MELIYAIADYLNIPNEWVMIDKAAGDLIWFHVQGGGMLYTCKTVRNGKYLKKNSIRADFS